MRSFIFNHLWVVAIDNNNSLLLLLFALMIKMSDITLKTLHKLRVKMAK